MIRFSKKEYLSVALGDIVLYYGRSLTKKEIAYTRSQKILKIARAITGILLMVFGFGLFFLLVYKERALGELMTASFWTQIAYTPKLLFWLGVYGLSYVIYRATVGVQKAPELPSDELPTDLQFSAVPAGYTGKKEDISPFFTKDAQSVVSESVLVALSSSQKEVLPVHVFVALLRNPNISAVFLRLGLSEKMISEKLKGLMGAGRAQKEPDQVTYLSPIIFSAYRIARDLESRRVRSTDILLACVQMDESLQNALYELGVDEAKLHNVVAWARIREKLHEQYLTLRRAASRRSKHGMDKAMTAVATPYLNSLSQDLTLAAQMGRLAPCVAREQEIDEIFRIVEGGRQSVLLVGETGVGKMSIIEGIAQKMVEDRVPEKLQDKRFVQISTSALLAGATVSGAQERLLRIFNEVSRAGNIILFINNLHDLAGLTDTGGEGVDVSETIAEYLGPGNFMLFATTTPDGHNQHIINSQIGSVMAPVQVGVMNTNQAIQVLESKVGGVEYKHHVYFSYDAIEACVQLSQNFLHDQNLPDSAISLMVEAASHVKNAKGENQLVTADDVGAIVGQKTGIPATTITEDESTKLLRLEEQMHARVIGQDEAVTLVANALRRARAEIRSQSRPIANFLFLGPTGVGKTELAKTIAEVYFGGEKRMIRIDMSEYQDKSGIHRLIGQPGQQGTGILTEAVRQNPFSLVLFDEMEKADKDVLNLFLQVFDDGRLTDSVGRVIDFTNTIIIATSNAGTQFVQEQMQQGVDTAQIREKLIRGELKQYYRPEFLNRFDGIVLFKPLNKEEIKHIAGLMLKRVARDLEKRGVALRVEESGLEALAQVGFDPEFGARPMRRAIVSMVENKLADLLLQGKLKRRDTVVFDGQTGIRVERSGS